MSVTYQDSYHVKFSVNVCDTSGKHYHPIFWQCVWQIMWTVSLHHPIFRQWPWHIWIIAFSDNVCDILGQLPCQIFCQCLWHIKTTLSSNFLTRCVTNQANCVTVSFQFPPMSVTYQVNYLVKFSENVCDISGKLYHFIIPFSDNMCDKSGKL